MCKNAAYLYDFECVDTCPDGYVGTGTGNFNRQCVVSQTTSETCAGTTTTVTAQPCDCGGDCHTCDWINGEASDCRLCKNAAYLFEFECVETCPDGYIGTGTGNFNRQCVANRRRSILAAVGLANDAPDASASSGAVNVDAVAAAAAGVALVAFVIAAALVVSRRGRRQQAVLPTTTTTATAATAGTDLDAVTAN